MTDLLNKMLRIRMIEEEIARRYSEQKMRTPVHLSIGQEAAAVGVASVMGPNDLAVSTHRSHAHYLAMGGSLNALIAELYGKETGCSGGFGGSMHLVDRSCGFYGSTSIVSGTIPVGVGMAFAKKLKKEDGTVVIFHGDAAIEEGVWHESANFAALHNLNVLFVCENNGYSCYTPLKDRQPRSNFSQLASAHGLRYYCEGSNVEDIRNSAAAAIKRGPAFLEIFCTRHYEHCGPKKELEIKDEISDMPRSTDLVNEINEAFRLAEEAPWPKPMSLLCP